MPGVRERAGDVVPQLGARIEQVHRDVASCVARSLSASSCARCRNDTPNTNTGRASAGVGSSRASARPRHHRQRHAPSVRRIAAPISASCHAAVAIARELGRARGPSMIAGIQSGRDCA